MSNAEIRAAVRTCACARLRLYPEARISVDHVPRQLWPLPSTPQLRGQREAVAQRATIGALAARDRPRDAHEFGPHLVGAAPHGRVAMRAHIDELEVRREVGVRQRERPLVIEALRVLEARAHAVPLL